MQTGFTVWFTGLPSSGKSTLARMLEKGLKGKVDFSGTILRELLVKGTKPPYELIRPEVADTMLSFKNPFVK